MNHNKIEIGHFKLQMAMLTKNEPLMVINGTEITKPMPPGHFNASFCKRLPITLDIIQDWRTSD